jgi:hypothetical protein
MSAELKAVTEQIYEPDQLPIVLKSQDVMNLSWLVTGGVIAYSIVTAVGI